MGHLNSSPITTILLFHCVTSQKEMHELLRISVGANHVTDKQIDKLDGANNVISLELARNVHKFTTNHHKGDISNPTSSSQIRNP